MKRSRRAAALLLAVFLSACHGNEPVKPGPGMLVATLSTPRAEPSRAAVVLISGPEAVTEVQGASPAYFVAARSEGMLTRVAVFGTLVDGPLLRFTVPDARRAGEYRATVVDAADSANAPSAAVAEYALTLAPAGR
ncbi:MAG: hypothetical protein JO306_13110 [Gemmatimonadetes bacterium]|nr:hypothetical protein [Gemmatimonadota bacterium]